MRMTSIGVAVLVLATGGSAMLSGTALSATSSDSQGASSRDGTATNTCRTMDQYGQFVPDSSNCSASATGTPGY
jgi:hypothetical protein